MRMYPRAKTLGIVVNNNQLLVEEFSGQHSKGEGIYYRPIGGTIEIGEKSEDALVREFMEELNVEVIIKHYIGCLENIFKIHDEIVHEIIQIYSVEFIDTANYKREMFEVIEGDRKASAKWVPLDDFNLNRKILYPHGLIERLTKLK